MAILVDFKKVREDRQEVEYIFGPPPRMARRLVIDKSTETARPLDGTVDRDYTAVLVKILRFHRAQQTWPAMGSYAA